jgi:hypothetical protein
MYIRKSASKLTGAEQKAFAAAVLELKSQIKAKRCAPSQSGAGAV